MGMIDEVSEYSFVEFAKAAVLRRLPKSTSQRRPKVKSNLQTQEVQQAIFDSFSLVVGAFGPLLFLRCFLL
jgi:hypothetical protein